MSTADPHGAQAHARAMGHTRVAAMPTLPASAAASRPPGVAAGSMLWETTLGAGGYAGKELRRGVRLQLQDRLWRQLRLRLLAATREFARLNPRTSLTSFSTPRGYT